MIPASPSGPHSPARLLTAGFVTAAIYFAAALAGFRVAFLAEQVTTVWAPTGIAIAGLLLWGPRLWPAIWIGAFAANATTSAPLWTAVLLASGNTLEALVAVWVLRRITGFQVGFLRVRDVCAFVGVAVLGATTVSASIGTVTLCAAGVQSWSGFPRLWFDWWLGDALGALLVAPAILTAASEPRLGRRAVLILAAFVVVSAAVTHAVFSPLLGTVAHPLEYVVFPLAIAAAVTGVPVTTASVVLAASSVTIWHTIHGAGPFAGPELHRNLILLQMFVGVLAATALLLTAAIAERQATERRERESAARLRRREEMLRLAHRAGGVATFEWDFARQEASCSAEFFEVFGLPGRDGVMKGAEWATFVHPDDREMMAAHLARALEGVEPASIDYRIVRADGAERWLTYAGEIQATPDGPRMLGTVVDITARMRSEIALKEAKEAAESANRLKDQFLATLSHELRTPLNAIVGYARMLQVNAIAPEQRERAIEVIARNAAAQNQLIEELLDISRITRGVVRLEPSAVDVAQALHEAIEGVRPAADAKQIALVLDVDPTAGAVTADVSRLRQVLWNVLANAVKFTEPGGRVMASARRRDRVVVFEVADTGRGIAADFLPFAFEPFRQAGSRFGGEQGGLGLGLAISKQLVELHGGTIHLSSGGIGQGTTVAIHLPARLAPVSAAAAIACHNDPAGPSLLSEN